MGGTRDELLQAAEAEARRTMEVLSKLEDEYGAAQDRLDQLDDEPFDTPEEEAELSRRMGLADQECGRLSQEVGGTD